MKKLNGEYSIDLGKWVNQKYILPTFNPDDMRKAIAEMIPNDFILNEYGPYLDTATDRFGNRHYHETNSLSPKVTQVVSDTFADILKRVR